MQIPEELLNKWKSLRSHGDNTKIAEQKGVTIVDVSRAFTYGECSDDTFKAIADFYKEKEEVVKEYLG